MQRPLFAFLAVASLAAAVLFSGAGCGGGGGGSSSGGSSGGNRPDGDIFSQQIVGTASGSSAARSLANLVVGDEVNLRSLAIYVDPFPDPGELAYQGGFYETVSAVNLDAPGVATLDDTTLTAIGVGTGTISLTGANGVTLFANVVVSASGRARISGKIRAVQVNNLRSGIASATARFEGSGGNILVEVVAGPDGTFVANVPTNAVRFVADFSALPNTFYNQFTYDTSDFTSTVTDCGVVLPSLSSDSRITLGDAVGYRKGGNNPPPPPADGCS